MSIHAPFLGPAPAKGRLPRRGVLFDNAWHTFAAPIVIWFARLQFFALDPSPLLGWLIHISVDRCLSFGLRGEDGGQAVF